MSGPRLSERIRQRLARPRHRGGLDAADAAERGLALNKVKVDTVTLNGLFDPETRVLYDGRFFTYGAPVGIAIVDALLDLAIGRTIEEIATLTGADVERSLRDDPAVPATDEGGRCFFGVVDALVAALADNMDRALAAAAASRSVRAGRTGSAAEELSRQIAAFTALPHEEQRRRVEDVLDEHVRPGLAADGGGLVLDDVVDGRRIIVTYQGACGSCGISGGMTLGFIESALKRHVHDQVAVEPTNVTEGMLSGVPGR